MQTHCGEQYTSPSPSPSDQRRRPHLFLALVSLSMTTIYSNQEINVTVQILGDLAIFLFTQLKLLSNQYKASTIQTNHKALKGTNYSAIGYAHPNYSLFIPKLTFHSNNGKNRITANKIRDKDYLILLKYEKNYFDNKTHS